MDALNNTFLVVVPLVATMAWLLVVRFNHRMDSPLCPTCHRPL